MLGEVELVKDNFKMVSLILIIFNLKDLMNL